MVRADVSGVWVPYASADAAMPSQPVWGCPPRVTEVNKPIGGLWAKATENG
jgi:hypothetical protein